MDAKQDARVMLAVKFLQLAEESSRNKSVKEAMRDAGFSEKEFKNSTRAEEAAVRRAYNGTKTKNTISTDLPIKVLNVNNQFPISPLSELQSTQSNGSTLATSKSVLTKTSNKILPGMKIVRQTSHQAHAVAQNALVLRKLRDNAIKETTKAWVEASELEKKGEQHKLKKEIIEATNNKPEYKGFVQVSERTIRLFLRLLLSPLSTFIKPLESMSTIEANFPRLPIMLSTQTLMKTEKAIS
jgi:hypothetical protein